MKSILFAVLGASALALTACSPSTETMAVSTHDVLEGYMELGYSGYKESLNTALTLQTAVDAFLAKPSAKTQQAAKDAWKMARKVYGQTEVYRFGNPNVDDWEGQVNAWPLDEGLIDYVSADYGYEEGNAYAQANIIAGSEPINADLLRSYHEKGGSEANVATGYHAIEFLLWGQDLNAKDQPSVGGQRSYTDYLSGGDCTNGHCERRGDYLKAATDLLVSDLKTIVADFAPDADNYRAAFLSGDETESLRRILFGMGSLSLGELAGQRINVALLANSQEDEHSCFSDNTHVDIAENAQGIRNVFVGEFTMADGSVKEVVSVYDRLSELDKALADKMLAELDATQKAAAALVSTAEAGQPFDVMIKADNAAGNEVVKALISRLKTQTGTIESVAKVMGVASLNPEASDSYSG